MLMSRAFGTLLLGLTTPVLGNKLLLSDPAARVVLRDTPVKRHTSADGNPRKHEAMSEIKRSRYGYTTAARTVGPGSEQTTEGPSRQTRRRRQSEDEESDTGSTRPVCRGRNDSTTNCPEETRCCVSRTGEATCCPAAGVTCDKSDCVQSTASLPPTAASPNLATITVTQTSIRTVSSFAETRVAVVTSTQLLTFLNPTQRTTTSTVTVTSFLRKAKRTWGNPPAGITPFKTSLLDHTSRPGRPTSAPDWIYLGARAVAEKRQEATLTSTVVVTTTIFVPGITTRTLTNIVFSTTFAAPNAATTVFVTTTVFRPSSSSSIDTVPGVTVPTSPSSPQPTPSSITESSSPTSLSATGSTASTGPVPTDSASMATGIIDTLFPTDVTTTTTATFPPTPSSTESVTTLFIPEGTMMGTMSTSPTATITPSPIPNPFPSPQPTLTPAQIAALVLGIVLALLLFVALAFLLRRLVISRRQKQAQLRQRLSPSPPPLMTAAAVVSGSDGRHNGDSKGGAAPAPIIPTGPSSSNTSSNYSGLTGEGEVRIVIRPAPKRRTQSSGVGVVWPMPPNRFSSNLGTEGQQQQQQQQRRGYSIFMEDSPSPSAAPEKVEDQKEWSIASERGSLGGGRDEDDDNRRREGAGGSVLSSTTSGYGYGYSTRGESYPGLGTLLTPPPPPAPLRLRERQEMEQEREAEIRGFRTGLLGGRDTTTDGDSGSSREGTIPPVPVSKRPVTRGTEDSGHRADQSESDNNKGGSKDSSPISRKSGNVGGQGGSGTLGKKGSFGLGKGKAW